MESPMQRGEEAAAGAANDEQMQRSREEHDKPEEKNRDAMEGVEEEEEEKKKKPAAAPSVPSAAAAAAAAGDGAMQKPLAPYFLFLQEKRAEMKKQEQLTGQKKNQQNQQLTVMWKGLSEEEKKVYVDRFREERDKYEAVYGKFTTKPPPTSPKKKAENTDLNAADKTNYPAARVKKIMALDDDVAHLSKEAVTLVTKASELFTAWLAEKAYALTKRRDRKSLQVRDFDQVLRQFEKLEFMRATFRAEPSAETKTSKRQPKTSSSSSSSSSGQPPAKVPKITEHFSKVQKPPASPSASPPASPSMQSPQKKTDSAEKIASPSPANSPQT